MAPEVTADAPLHIVVDAANVIGSRPDGWWHDREGAARRLAGQLVAAMTTDTRILARGLGQDDQRPLRVHLVLEGVAARVPDLPTHSDIAVVLAEADGDSAIVDLVGELDGEPVLVVTADRDLRNRVEGAGAGTIGPGALLRALPG
jgi:hypothetical protein